MIVAIIGLIIVGGIILFFVSSMKEADKYAVKVKEEQQKSRNNKLQKYDHLLQMLPNPDMVIEYPGNYVLVKESTSQIILNEHLYNFDDIIDYSVVDNQTATHYHSQIESTTKTNTGDMIGRAVVGGVVAGGIGAAVGANTAKKTTVTNPSTTKSFTHHNYVINVTLNSISNPVESLNIDGYCQTAFDKIINTLKVIVHRNKANGQQSNESQIIKQ